MLGYTGSKISPHMIRKENGTLVCVGVPIAREGTQPYRLNELGIGSGDEVVKVIRPAAEVFSAVAIASFEGVPICDEHPSTFLRPENWAGYARGHAQNVRPGPESPDGRLLLADLVVHDGDLISKIENGKRGISCGYSCQYVSNADGTYRQTRIRGNHIAVVPEPRGGEYVRINDGVPVCDASDFADLCKRYHRRNAGEVPETITVRWPLRSMTAADNRKEEAMKKQDWSKIHKELDNAIGLLEEFIASGKVETRTRRTLVDEINSIVRSARHTEELARSGVGPGRFHEQLRRLNQAYDRYAQGAEAGQSFADAANEAGALMRGEDYEATLKRFRSCRTLRGR
jgi:hypothetical protein